MIDILTGVVNQLPDRSGDNGWLRGKRRGARPLVQAEGAAEETEHHAVRRRRRRRGRCAAGDCRLLQVRKRETHIKHRVTLGFLRAFITHGASAPRIRKGARRLINSV